ncbi:MAG: alpha/beta fold hydrolase [Burkholderiaceae bacterium]|nr:alpha/beta fold hydrolase [Burkholderiaceae bacterium]
MDPYDHDLERGVRNRRRILGDAWVDKSVANANAFNADFQNFITRYAWHEVWGRPGLDAKTRRIIVMTITASLGRWEEYELHLRAALTGGGIPGVEGSGHADTRLSPDEVKEVLMQTAIYAGVPAANTGMSIAARLLRELGHDLPPQPATEVENPGTGRSYRSAGTPALHYTVREPRSHRAPEHTVVLSHALGADVSMWDELANALAATCRVICFDHRGHGDSDAPAGAITMAELADGAERLLAEIDNRYASGPVVWIGLSLGGMVGQELALRHPHRIAALVIANACAGYCADGRAQWQQRMDTVASHGLEAIADGTMQRWFSDAFRESEKPTVARWRRRVVSTSQAGYLAACHAVMNHDTKARLTEIGVPTLVIAGNADLATPVGMLQGIVDAVPGAQLAVIDGAAHLTALEAPAAFEAAVRTLLARV